MPELKPISIEAVPAALAKAERYRLLNEPSEAESICRDVVQVDPNNQEALIMLLLSLTDEFDAGECDLAQAREVLSRIEGEFQQAYYAGIVNERWGRAQLRKGVPGSTAHGWFVEAMRSYEQAERLSPPGNDDAVLRWNTCVRLMERDTRLRPREAGYGTSALAGDLPLE